MPSSHATVRTERASRYLTQLAGHTTRMSHGIRALRRHGAHEEHDQHGDGDGGEHGANGANSGGGEHDGGAASPGIRGVEASATEAVIDFGRGRCTVQATLEELTLRAEAEDAQELRRIQDGIAKRLERIGRRDRLTVSWRPDAADRSS